MKKAIAAVSALLVSAMITAAPAGSQETTTTTTTVPETTTTVAETTTTAVGETTTTTIPDPGGDLELVELPGESVTEGTLNFALEFYENTAANCTGALNIAGGNMNMVRNEAGNLGALYGMEATGSGNAGLFMIELGAVPAAVAVLSVSDANCEFDAVGVGNWEATATTGSLDGVGAGVYPGAYDTGEFISSFRVDATVTQTGGPASLDLEAAEAFFTRPRA